MRANRLSSKQSDAESQRRAMTERRTMLSDKIRKSRRSHAVSLKRKLNSTLPTSNATIPGHSFEEIAIGVIQTPTDIGRLQQLENILMQQQKLMVPSEVSFASALANALAVALQYGPTQLAAGRILTNLAATESTGVASDDDGVNYYGNSSPTNMTWSMLLTQTPGLLEPALRDAISQQDSVDLSSQCCWFLGNLAGDVSCRASCLTLVPVLIQVLRASLVSQQVSVCRNATWAVSNLARGPSARPFLGDSLLTPSLISQILLAPERMESDGGTITWSQVAYEMLWTVAFLTARDEEAVDYLCNPTADNMSFSSQSPRLLCEALACRLASQVEVIPCLRAIGNIATACSGLHIPGLLEAHSGSLASSLSMLLSHHATGDAHVVATEAAWAAGTLLCDAGAPDHSSTKHAVPVLLPRLCATVTSEYSQLDLKRECVGALWNACAAYPGEPMGDAWRSRSVRDDFLLQIYQTPKMLRTVVDLLETAVDMDLTMVAVQLINSMLRRLQETTEIRLEFTELGGVDALEGICDRASQSSQYGYGESWKGGNSEAADIAADLIDDLFSGDEDEELEGVVPMALENQFAFGVVQPTPAFDFGPVPISAGRGRGVSSKPAWMVQKELTDLERG